MANFSVMTDVPNPVFDSNGNPFSGAVLKAFLPGGTTATSIAIDEDGNSPQATITYNAAGKLEVSGNEILPYIDKKHKWGIFANAADATANTPFYMGPFDDVPRPFDDNSKDRLNPATLASAVSDPSLEDGDVLHIKEITTGSGGSVVADVVLLSTVTPNAFDIFASTGDVTLAIVLRVKQSFDLIRQFGGVEGVAASSVITEIKSRFGLVMIPNGSWIAQDIALLSNDNIWFESRTAVLRGVLSSNDLFVSSGAVTGVCVRGGRIDLCNNAFVHTGNSALASSVFEGTLYTNMVAGFDLSSSVGNTWRSNQFGVGSGDDNITYGIRFRKTGTGQTNQNNFFANRYSEYSFAGISFDDTAIIAASNKLYGEWFEDSGSHGLFIGGTVTDFKMFGGYFETTGSASLPDLLIEQSVGSTITGVALFGVTFNASVAAQTARIRNTGNSAFKAVDCNCVLSASQVFAEVDGSSAFHTELYNTRLNAPSGAYGDLLFSQVGTQQISWSTYVGSSGATNDDTPLRVNTGLTLPGTEVNFVAADATPSVRTGMHFRTSGTTTITTFDDMTDGQEITVRAGNTITVVGVAMVLNDIAKFYRVGGVIYHINK